MTGPATCETDTVIRRLCDWHVDAIGLHPGGSNYVFVARLKPPPRELALPEDDGAQPLLAIYKPSAGERSLRDFPYGTLHKRERAAYLVSRALGWPSLPPLVIRDGPHGEGSFQQFIEHDAIRNYFNLRDECLPQFAPVAAFDTLIHNVDRKGGSVLNDARGRIWAIDNALSFNPFARRRTVMLEFWGKPYPEGTTQAVERVIGCLQPGQPLRADLDGLLDDIELVSLLERAEEMVARGVHPKLNPEINVPWPFV